MHVMRVLLQLCPTTLFVLSFLMPCPTAADESTLKEQTEEGAALQPYTGLTAGALGGYNPLTGAVFLETVRIYPYRYSQTIKDVWSHLGPGAQTIICPAYLQQAAFVEWMPALFLVLKLRYDIYYYFGAFGAVLSYESVPSGFMESDLNAQKGEEAKAFGQRVLFQPTLRGRIGPVSAQNQTDVAWYDTRAKGPYVFNWEYETFTSLKDLVIENRTDILLTLQKGEGETVFMVGPQYTFTWAESTDLKRHRLGVSVYWVPRDRKDKSGYFWMCLMSGVNIQAALEQGSPYLVLAAGGSWQMSRKRRPLK